MIKLFKAHLKRQWSGFLTTAIFIILAAVMLTVGLSINVRAKTLLDEKIEKNNTANYLSIYSSWDKDFNAKIKELFENNDNLTDLTFSSEIVLTMELPGNFINSFYCIKYDPTKEVSKREPYIVDNSIENGIYINTCLADQHKLSIGDKITINSHNGKIERQIKGLFEEYLILWSPMIMMEANDYDPIYEFAINQANPEKPIVGENGEIIEPNLDNIIWNATFVEYNVKDKSELERFLNETIEKYFTPLVMMQREVNFNTWNTETTKTQLLSFANILSAVLIVFSFIMTAVSLIVIRFIIISNMEDDIKNVGILKALGYTTTNLRTVVFSEYLSIGIIAAIIGGIMSTFILPVFTKIIGMTIYLDWRAKVTFLSVFLGIVIPPLLISGVVWLITSKFKKITPVMALRGKTNSTLKVKKNRLPLKKYDKLVHLTISLKSILNEGMKWISIGIVMIVVSFFSVFTYMLHYNLNIDNRTFVGLTGNQPADVLVYTNHKEIINFIDNLLEVEQISRGGNASVAPTIEINDKFLSINLRYYVDYSQTKLNVLYEGKYPTATDEIVLVSQVAEYFNIKIGDNIPIKNMGEVLEFKVVGLAQNMSSGQMAYVTQDGFKRYENEKNFDCYEFMIFAKKGTNLEDLYNKLYSFGNSQSYLDNEFFNVINKEDSAKMYISDSIMDGSKLLTVVMDAIAFIALFIILMFIIRLKLIREKKNIALNKALGSTTFGVMTEISVGTVLVIAVSVVFGGVLGALLSEKLLSLVLLGFGIKKLTLIIPIWHIIILIGSICLVSYIIANILSLATKKISPRHLQVN